MQAYLRRAGFDPGLVYGDFGRVTADAVRALQRDASIRPIPSWAR